MVTDTTVTDTTITVSLLPVPIGLRHTELNFVCLQPVNQGPSIHIKTSVDFLHYHGA